MRGKRKALQLKLLVEGRHPQSCHSYVPIGHVSGVFGLQGWVKLALYTRDLAAVVHYPRWFVRRADHLAWEPLLPVPTFQINGHRIVARFAGTDGPHQARLLSGLTLAVLRADLPALREDEHYWTDLMGLDVVNLQGQCLGVVSSWFETGANDVMVVEPLVAPAEQIEKTEQNKQPSRKPVELWIPYQIPEIIQSVDYTRGVVTVDWVL